MSDETMRVVRWIDICGHDGWCTASDAETARPVEVTSFGHYVGETDDALTIAMSQAKPPACPWGNMLTIPWSSVIEYYEVELER